MKVNLIAFGTHPDAAANANPETIEVHDEGCYLELLDELRKVLGGRRIAGVWDRRRAGKGFWVAVQEVNDGK